MFGSRTCFIIFLLLARLGLLESRCEGSDDCRNDEKEEKDWWSSLKRGAMNVTGAIATIIAITVVLGAAGFTRAGIAAGSLAAVVQSMMGGTIIAGGIFSTLQAIGAGGLGLAAKVVIGIIGGFVTDIFMSDNCDENK